MLREVADTLTLGLKIQQFPAILIFVITPAYSHWHPRNWLRLQSNGFSVGSSPTQSFRRSHYRCHLEPQLFILPEFGELSEDNLIFYNFVFSSRIFPLNIFYSHVWMRTFMSTNHTGTIRSFVRSCFPYFQIGKCDHSTPQVSCTQHN